MTIHTIPTRPDWKKNSIIRDWDKEEKDIVDKEIFRIGLQFKDGEIERV